ncbi:hypothetical protein CASFOL_031666 [Castilleja foliolosa]|uniref:CASP-like protein n=1 Tax=Castilleja foliolosa TaxID=1961234 RepID=A0ABD3C5D1_9LAMI
MAKPSTAIAIRVLAGLCYMIAAIILLLTHQTVRAQSLTIIITSLDWDGLWYCLIVYFIGCFYNFLVIFLPAGSPLWKTVIAIDVILNIAVGASIGVGWEIYTPMKRGYLVARWYPICGVVPYFCSKLLGSLISATFGFTFSISLLMYTLHVIVDPFLIQK